MKLWGAKADALVEELRGQIAYLREQVASRDLRIQDLERHIIALSHPASYPRLYPAPHDPKDDEVLPEPILSPRKIPAYKIADEKFWEQTESAFARNVQSLEQAMALKLPPEES